VTGGRRVRVHYSVTQQVTAPDSSAARALATWDAATPDAATRETATLAGDLVPADVRLVDARDLHVQQAAMTGEALPVEKTAAGTGWTAPAARRVPGDEAHLVMLGTSVVSGTGVAIVTATGNATAYGDIARRLVSRRRGSIFDFLTFWVLLAVFHESESFFHTGWFVESLVTQTLVLLVIRTAENPLHSRPSRALAASIAAIVVIGVCLPYVPFAPLLGFTRLPARFFQMLVAFTVGYLMLVQGVKARVMRRWLA